jgi:hypothetical protein
VHAGPRGDGLELADGGVPFAGAFRQEFDEQSQELGTHQRGTITVMSKIKKIAKKSKTSENLWLRL